MWDTYVTAPWTRDGRVRVQVLNISPQVSGQVVALDVVDNQPVKKGDVLYAIDPADFQIAVTLAEANVASEEANLFAKQQANSRRRALGSDTTSTEEKQQFDASARAATAAVSTARANLALARLNLDRTQVRSTVDGRVTNLLMRVGDYAVSGSTKTSVIDTGSFWLDGYFEETKMAGIKVGDPAEILLLGQPQPIRGTVDSITLGISTADALPGTQGLPNVNPVYTWVRLAQRVPVRIRIEQVPEGCQLVAGETATISVMDPRARPSLGSRITRWIGWASHLLDGAPQTPQPS